MTRSEMMEKLEQEGRDVAPTTINYAVAAGSLSRPTKNGAGLYEYTEEHLQQMREYLESPRHGRRQLATA